ncbi:MAG: prepilin-type N-terminal cleavage/methylation domain-containing protein [Candidatus Omnitrophica bacterium]|nr:prepilin-type N-terminal cleavage/methylation domain-containing protein [Candidatus Omnitrophota bacterium]
MKPYRKKGFTLIELAVVTSLVAIILSALYVNFQTGLMAYRRSEEHLVEQHEAVIFLNQLEGELRNAIPYFHPDFQHHFVGKERSVVFPARLHQYSAHGVQEDLYLVRYEVVGDQLVRTERKLREKFKDRTEQKETVFKRLENCRFEFLYVNSSDELQWKKEWLNVPYVGLPRGIRLSLRGSVFGAEGKVAEILLPQGVLLKQGS